MTVPTPSTGSHRPTGTGLPVIEIAGLRKSFGDREVLRGIDLRVL